MSASSSSPNPRHTRPWIFALAFAVLLASWLGFLLASRLPVRSGGWQALLPAEDREVTDEVLLLLLPEGPAGDDPQFPLRQAAEKLGEAFGDERIPLAAPKTELSSWLDRHAFYLFSSQSDAVLRERLAPSEIAAAVESLRARLSSPVQGTTSDDLRRDPLGLYPLLRAQGLQLQQGQGLEVTGGGDLLASDPNCALLLLRSEQDTATLRGRIDAAVAGLGVKTVLLGPRLRDEVLAQRLGERLARSLSAGAAGVFALLLLMGKTFLRSGPGLVAIAAGLCVFLQLSPEFDVWTISTALLWLGWGGMLWLAPRQVLPLVTILAASCLLPLLLFAWPALQALALPWLAASIAAAVLRWAWLRFARNESTAASGPANPSGQGAWPGLTVLLACFLASLGVWSLDRLQHGSLHSLASSDSTLQAAEILVAQRFGDPERRAFVQSEAATAQEALDKAVGQVQTLRWAVPQQISSIDSPALLVLPEQARLRRRVELATMDLPASMQLLRESLESRGFRADAFGEFLQGTADLGDQPSAQAALEGELGAWIERYLRREPERVVFRSLLELPADREAALPKLLDPEGNPVMLRGAAVVARREQARLLQHVTSVMLFSCWFASFAAWLLSRKLLLGITCGIATVLAQLGLLSALAMLRIPLGAYHMPVLLLQGAAAAAAASTACLWRSDAGSWWKGLLPGAAPMVSAAALLGFHEPVATAIGYAAILGFAIASACGLVLGPGLLQLATLLTRKRSSS